MRIKKYSLLIIVFVIIIIASLDSCQKIVQLSAIPYIRFNNFAIFDTTDILGNQSKGGRLNFYFEDGDGDLGLPVPAEVQTDTSNLFFTLYRKIGGVMVPASAGDPLYPSPYTIPYMVRVGQNKNLKGTIVVTFLYLFYSPGDTIMYDFYIKDRALHESNVASTGEIVLSVNGLYTK
jgi:hypothetical protein